MIQLVYYSISNLELTSEDMTDILVSARAYNSKNKITGCLLYHNKIFLQLLEGEKEIVLNLYESIKKDKRHSNITFLVEEEIKDRMFPGWSMAFHEFKNNPTNINQFIKNIDFFAENTDKQTETIDLFWRMAKQIVVK
jgi:hypothetical protein